MGRRRVTLIQDGTVVRIKGWKVAELARGAGLRPTFSGVTGWTIDTKRLPELAAFLEYRNVDYSFEPEADIPSSPSTPRSTPAPQITQAGLW